MFQGFIGSCSNETSLEEDTNIRMLSMFDNEEVRCLLINIQPPHYYEFLCLIILNLMFVIFLNNIITENYEIKWLIYYIACIICDC